MIALLVKPGNGPSGIALSYLLSGHWPRYAGHTEDEFLHARLGVEPGLSLVEQDLEFLSDVSFSRPNWKKFGVLNRPSQLLTEMPRAVQIFKKK